MSHASYWEQVRTGFARTFWVANIIELFERFAYYGSKAILAVYIAEQVGLGPGKAGFLVGSVFNFLLYLLPVAAGTIVDRFGFRKSLLACFSIFCLGYFLIGLGGLDEGVPVVNAIGGGISEVCYAVARLFSDQARPFDPATTYMVFSLVVTALGGSLIKPCIVGTVARTTTPETKGLGYSVYYTLVNLGGAIGPLLALQVRQNAGIAYVLVMSSVVSLLLVVATLVFYREPPVPADVTPQRSFLSVLGKMLLLLFSPIFFFASVLGSFISKSSRMLGFKESMRPLSRFMSFLFIFSGFWIMFWEIFYALPFYVRDVLHFEKFEIIETVDAWTIILVTVPITALAKKLKPLAAMTLGFAIASASWFVMGAFPTLAMTIVAIVIFAMGESLQAPRYYEYVADLAPKEQVGTYMGFAFLPIAIGTFIAGWIAGPLVERYVGVRTEGVFTPGPEFANAGRLWFWIGGIGVVSTLAMLAYDRLVVKRR